MGTESVTFSTRRFLLGKAGPFPRLVFREEVMLALDQFSHLHSQGEHGGFLVGRKKDIKTAFEERFEVKVDRVYTRIQKDGKHAVIKLSEGYSAEDVGMRVGVF